MQVYDVNGIPPEGIHYAVRLPVDLDAYRQACKKGPRVVRVLAILLCWNTPAPNNLPPDPYGRPSPFAGRVTVQGAPVVGWSFMVEVGHDGALWTPVLTDPKVVLAGGGTKDHKANPVTTRFAHLPLDENVNGLMAQGDTAGDAK